MIGSDLVFTMDQAKSQGNKITHRTNKMILGVDDKVVILQGEQLKIAIEGAIWHGDDNFGSGVVAITNLRIVFVGKGSVQGIVSGVLRAAGGGRTYLQLSGNRIARAEEHGIMTRCRFYVKEKGFFGKEKLDKYDIRPKGEYKEYILQLVSSINEIAGLDFDETVKQIVAEMESEDQTIQTPHEEQDQGIESNTLSSKKNEVCPDCGNEIESNWVVCPTCGLNLPRKCQNCGANLEADWNSCPYCST